MASRASVWPSGPDGVQSRNDPDASGGDILLQCLLQRHLHVTVTFGGQSVTRTPLLTHADAAAGHLVCVLAI
jgi:hypothetical protein